MFISIEGIDGSGKTSLCKSLNDISQNSLVSIHKRDLAKYMPEKTQSYVHELSWRIWEDDTSKFPADRYISDIANMSAWFILFDRHVIRPMLDRGLQIIFDGWIYKFICRHATRSQFELDILEAMLKDISKPDCVFYLDTDPEIALSRRNTFTLSECGYFDGYKNKSEGDFLEYQRIQKREYDQYALANNWEIIDTDMFNQQLLAKHVYSRIQEMYFNCSL